MKQVKIKYYGTALLSLLVCLLLMQACAPQRKNPLSNVFHNTTAHYNAYFIANEKIKEVESTLQDGYQWNYNKILPVYVEFDTTDTAPLKDQLKEVLEKAALAIQRHPGSDWEDDSYILVGKARFYGFEFADAVETYKYVNTHSKKNYARHEALVELMRTFVKNNELRNAAEVSDYLQKQDLNKKNLKNLYVNRAYLYQQRQDLDKLVGSLVKAEELTGNNKEKARLNFMIGQIYQQLGYESNAYEYYRNVLKNSPSYELYFYTRLNIAQVTDLKNASDNRKVRKFFDKLLADRKNLEYRDKIYYEIGNFELKQGNVNEAIQAYKSSAAASVNNQRQKAYSFLQLGKIYYDSLKSFQLAENYYDSTLAVLPKDEENYEAIRQRREILGEFVKNLNIIVQNDSLLNLADMDTQAVRTYLSELIEVQRTELEAKKAADKKRQRRAAAAANRPGRSTQDNQVIGLNNSSSGGGTWYFYNASTLGRGATEFKRLWGDRALTDNWRRKERQFSPGNLNAGETENIPETVGKGKQALAEAAEEKEDQLPTVEEYLATLPYDTASRNKLNAEVEEAMYNLGKIYHFQLKEDPEAIATFNRFLPRFTESDHTPEILYLLYLISDENNASAYKQDLVNRFPESIYAKIALNPNYREENNAITARLMKLYDEAYSFYEQNEFKKAATLLNSAIAEHPDNEFTDNLALLNILITGKTEDVYKYQFELNAFGKKYPNSDLLGYVMDLIKSAEEYQLNLVNSSRAKYSTNFDYKHVYALVYDLKDNSSEKIPPFLKKKLEEMGSQLISASLVFSKEKGVVLINDLPDKASAQAFIRNFKETAAMENTFKAVKMDEFVISDHNFNILYQTKELDSYIKFYKNNY